jgi:hypothetical protein
MFASPSFAHVEKTFPRLVSGEFHKVIQGGTHGVVTDVEPNAYSVPYFLRDKGIVYSKLDEGMFYSAKIGVVTTAHFDQSCAPSMQVGLSKPGATRLRLCVSPAAVGAGRCR